MNKKIIALVGAFFLSQLSQAALIESGWPPPGSPAFAGSGESAGHAGGSTWSFSNFNTAEYDELYFGLKNIEMGEAVSNSSNAGQSGAGTGVVSMTYNSSATNLAGGTVVWDNSFEFYNAASNNYEIVAGTFTLTITDSGSNPLSLIDAGSLGLDPNLGGLLNISGDFSANMLFEINDTTALPWYDSAHNNPINQLRTSFNSAWYYSEPTAVPVPAAAWLFSSALIGLAGIKRKK